MALYFDTSALSPLFIPDVHTKAVSDFLRDQAERSSVSSLTMIELTSIASRSVRARRTRLDDAHEALRQAVAWTSQKCDQIDLVSADYAVGEDYVRRFDLGLRAPDALHVAICRRLGFTLLTCDLAQARAARELGIQTIELSGGHP